MFKVQVSTEVKCGFNTSSTDSTCQGGLKCPTGSCTFASQRARLPHLIHVNRHSYIVTKKVSTMRPCQSPKSAVQVQPEIDLKENKSHGSSLNVIEINNNHSDQLPPLLEGPFYNNLNPPPSAPHHSIIKINHQFSKLKTLGHGPKKVILPTTTTTTILGPTIDCRVPCVSLKRNKLGSVEDGPQNFNGTVWFKCKLCGFRTLEKLSLANHIVFEHKVDDLICKICSLKFTSPDDLECHYRGRHRRPVTAQEYDKSSILSDGEIQIEMNLEDLYKAGVRIKSPLVLKWIKLYPSLSALITVTALPDVCGHPNSIKNVVETHHPEMNVDGKEEEDGIDSKTQRCLNIRRDDDDVQTPSNASVSCKGLKTIQLKRPKSRRRKKYRNDRIPSKRPPYITGEFRCPKCPVIMITLQSLGRHLERSHVKGGKYPCNICSCVFNIFNGLRGHKAKYHRPKGERKSKQTKD